MELSPLGRAVSEAWEAISSHYPQVAVIAQQVMPDHFHGILFFREQADGLHLGHVVRGFKTACNRAYRALFPSLLPPSSFAATLSQPTSKAAGGGLLWARGYNDRILHNYGTLDKWKAYLRDNPRRLQVKREHPEFFRVQRNLQFAGLTFSAIGNHFLLKPPWKFQVQCSRRLTDEEIERRKQDALAVGAQGAVFVSPSISKGEKVIMHAVFEAGYPIVYLQENGFAELAKPGGQRFDACARGQMLILAPWEHHNERTLIQRGQCLQLNEMARLICEQ